MLLLIRQMAKANVTAWFSGSSVVRNCNCDMHNLAWPQLGFDTRSIKFCNYNIALRSRYMQLKRQCLAVMLLTRAPACRAIMFCSKLWCNSRQTSAAWRLSLLQCSAISSTCAGLHCSSYPLKPLPAPPPPPHTHVGRPQKKTVVADQLWMMHNSIALYSTLHMVACSICHVDVCYAADCSCLSPFTVFDRHAIPAPTVFCLRHRYSCIGTLSF